MKHSFNNSLRPSRAVRGFTLIELMITIAVVGILMTIAVTSYDFAVVKARRGAAQGCLTETAQYMERFYTTRLSYVDAAGNPPALPGCSSDVVGHYDVDFTGAPTASTFVLNATPQGAQAAAEKKCGTMTINQAGARTGATDDCWQ